MKILVRTPNWIGDHVMARPFYAGLRNSYPGATITFLKPDTLAEFEDASYCDYEILLTKQERKSSNEFLNKALSLRKEKFDLALSLPASFRSALFLYFTGAKTRVGFSQGGSGIFYHSSLSWKGQEAHKHKSALYFSLLEFLTAHSGTPSVSTPTKAASQKYFVLAPGASIPLREYPHFSELLFKLSKRYPDYKIILVGSSAESKYDTQVERLKLVNVENRIGKTTLKDVIALCSKASAVICNDSGVAHLSATLAGAKTIVLMGPGDPDYILPLGGQAFLVRLENLGCSPCEKPYCRAAYGYQVCLKGIRPEVILEKMKSLTL